MGNFSFWKKRKHFSKHFYSSWGTAFSGMVHYFKQVCFMTLPWTVESVLIPSLFSFKQSHTNFVNCVKYSPNGEHFVSGGADGMVWLFCASEIGKCSIQTCDHVNMLHNKCKKNCWNGIVTHDLVMWKKQSAPEPTELLVHGDCVIICSDMHPWRMNVFKGILENHRMM